ncbi:hypothetical protein SAMN04490182_0165 [Pseudomonas cedrina]|uniref:Uncharacterized protein n=1 Tax=Pseudomonas cedrina TaxID=651740 RepID=A0ABY0U2Q7_PSECE|nr:hypothetical protein [Pseudomonas cedrina]SDR86304.1 hypothetical protein SAMN04490182_0165 [Pseudomonas cedrina]
MTVSLNDSFITTRTSPEYSTSSATVNANAETRATTPAGSENSTKDRATVTTLAGQLSDAALRAKASYGSHTKQQLKTMHHENFQRLTGREYNNNKTQHDTETPNTSDPTLLERAHMATRYVNNLGSNPFAGMPRDQLELIIFDDSGSFTVNERRAVLYEDYNQEQAWRKQVLAEYDIEKKQHRKRHPILSKCPRPLPSTALGCEIPVPRRLRSQTSGMDRFRLEPHDRQLGR